jgi:hypothetical protein
MNMPRVPLLFGDSFRCSNKSHRIKYIIETKYAIKVIQNSFQRMYKL